MAISQNSYLGRGVLAQLADVIRRASPRSVFLVKSPGAYKASGAEPLVEKALAGLETISFDRKRTGSVFFDERPTQCFFLVKLK